MTILRPVLLSVFGILQYIILFTLYLTAAELSLKFNMTTLLQFLPLLKSFILSVLFFKGYF